MNISETQRMSTIGLDSARESLLMTDNMTNKFENDVLKTHEGLKPIIDYLLLTMLIAIMLSMGCEITCQQLWNHLRRPLALIIGIVSQFGLKPLAAYAVLVASGVKGLQATGVLIISCCPGGVLSNTFTYFCDGDLPLSVAMTTASTIMAMGMLPANIWLYARHFETVSLVIPYDKMALSLLIVTSPIIVGMILKSKFPRVAFWTTKVGTYTGLLCMFSCLVIEVIAFPDMFTKTPPKLYAIILTSPLLGLILGYGISCLFKQNVPICKTVAIECGIQNFPIALTVISLSFPIELQGEIVLLPWLYGFSMITGCSVLTAIYQASKMIKRRNETKLADDEKKGNTAKGDFQSTVQIELKPESLKHNG